MEYQFAATSDVCHDYSAALCVVCRLHFVVTFTYMSILLTFCSIVMEYQFDYSTALCLACYFIIVQYVFVICLARLGMSMSMGQA
jgi:hypothetical protein